ncbi:hypothetical protein JHD50_06405 [Sulfurimonas sp. MAG313]|nr:hypothetical protein [Sulfurimonas sp. MAG313]MDF1880938.1 hypothetical protein [Sulfurimonas sp. MAG313]
MKKTFILFLLLCLYLSASTPNLYKSVGDPVYTEIPAIISLSKMNYFKKHKLVLRSFISTAKQQKNLGFAYDKKRRNKTLTKKEQKEYLTKIRDLKKELRSISRIVQKDLLTIIKINYVKTYYRLKKTHLKVLRLDPKSAKAGSQFEKKIHHKRRLAKLEKEQQKKRNKIEYYKYLRSSKNLDGKWKGESSDKTTMYASFHGKTVYLSYQNPKDIIIFKGSYKIRNNRFLFFIEQRKRTKASISHIKKVHFERIYKVSKITEKDLILKYKDETIYLKKVPK